jgi:glycosyltransferase involved in cell wall biosynthesis
MRRVLLIANAVAHYRVSVYNYLAERFREEGWVFEVASERRLGESEQQVGFTFYELPFQFGSYRELVERLQPDVVILHLHLKVPMYWPLLHWLKLRRVPVVSWTKGGNLDAPGDSLRQMLFNYTHILSDALVLYSPGQSHLIPRKHRHKIFAANNTVNFGDYPAIADTKDEIKKEFGLSFKKLVLFSGTMGIDGERKRVSHLIEIFRDLDHAGIGLVLVGSGMRPELKARINPSNTVVLGPVHDPKNVRISKLFKAADIYVVPGHVGLGINQAFYWGLPVITENCLQPPEIQYLVSGRNGFIVPDNDVTALREKMLYLLENDDVREEFSRRANEDIRRHASIDGMYKGFQAAVEYAVSGPARGAKTERQLAAISR